MEHKNMITPIQFIETLRSTVFISHCRARALSRHSRILLQGISAMQHETATRQKAEFCYVIPRILRRVRIAGFSAFLVTLLLLSEATQQANASSCSALFQSFRNAHKSGLAFQHAVIPLPLGKTSGPRREENSRRGRHGCPWVVCRRSGAAARRRAAPWALNDSGREEDMAGMRAIGEVGDVDSKNSTYNGDDFDDHSDFVGVAVAGKAAVVEGLGAPEGTSATSTERESADAAVASGLEVEEEVPSFDFAPAMTVHKFKTLQNRRVPVTIKYSGGGGFKRYFDEIATVLKKHFPDVLIDREIVEVSSTREEEVFEIRIDGKLVCTKKRGKPGVFLHMETFDQAIRKARQRRRPGAVVYGDAETYRNAKALADDREAGRLSIE